MKKVSKTNVVKTPTVGNAKVVLASKTMLAMIGSKPGFYQRHTVIKELSKKFDKETLKTAIAELRGHGKGKRQVKRVSGYALVGK